ncbi:MAG: hypothetical protein AAB899_01460, partial [Patescibacteria group bacterium]
GRDLREKTKLPLYRIMARKNNVTKNKLRKPAVYTLSLRSDIPRFVKTEEISSNKVALKTSSNVNMGGVGIC